MYQTPFDGRHTATSVFPSLSKSVAGFRGGGFLQREPVSGRVVGVLDGMSVPVIDLGQAGEGVVGVGYG